jgi:hypothetical protein
VSERRLLALSYAFPPMAVPEAQLIAKRLVNLQGWRADVIAASHVGRWCGVDPEIARYAESRVNSVTRIEPLFRLPWHRLGMVSRLPDALRFRNSKAFRSACRLGPTQFGAMLSWSQWHSIHLAALKIKRAFPKLPWLAHFSDPWVDNPFRTMRGLERRINFDLEKLVIEAADRVLFTTPETVELVMAKYPSAWRAKTRVIPHGFEPTLYSGEKPAPPAGRRMVARYIGNFYGDRTPEPLYSALAAALLECPRLADEVTVEIVGSFEKGMNTGPSAAQLPAGMIRLMPSVCYRESLRLMETADLLVVIDAPARNSVFLPSKLVDYIGSGRPIVALAPPGATARVVEEIGEIVADPGDVDASAKALLTAFGRAGMGYALNSARDRYSARATAAVLGAVLDEIST